MCSQLVLKNRAMRAKGKFSDKKVFMKNAQVDEGLSELTRVRMELVSTDHDIDLQDFLGEMTTIELDLKEGHRYFTGHCVSVEDIGLYQGMVHLVVELRPWFWFLTKATENRIFQEKTVVDIITEVLGDYGFSSDVVKKLSGTYKAREYCVQYAETDYDFLSRLMEEEGIYYFFDYQDGKTKMVLVDSVSGHSPATKDTLEFHFKEENFRRKEDHIFDWAGGTQVTSGKVTLDDYDFTKPSSDLKVAKAIPKGKHSYKSYELYSYPGKTRTEGVGDTFARIKMEAEAVRHLTSSGVGNVRILSVGSTFKMKGHPRVKDNSEFLMTRATHLLQVENDYVDEETLTNPFNTGNAEAFQDNPDTYRIQFDVIPKAEPFRAPLITPWPSISGLQTAVVTGPSGEEIYTDEYGRIKVQFHWDQDGKKDDKTTCWVRVVMPWTGKSWGMFSIPRIGQEVVIQFEEGDPDRPMCTGMLYHKDNKPPYAFPANMTQTGIVTRSTKSGSASTFNELVFEDKKEAEFVRFQSERDYTQTIKNNATITIGLEHKDDGNLTQTIHKNKTETLNTGDHTFTVKDGNQTISIKKDHTETIEGKSTQTITDDVSQTVKSGDYTQTISSGDSTRTVKSGDDNHTITSGDMTVKVSSGKVSVTAGIEIKLTVGANSITIDNSGITISGTMVTMEGTATVDVGAPSTTVSGDGMLTLQGGVVMIN